MDTLDCLDFPGTFLYDVYLQAIWISLTRLSKHDRSMA